jgi:hypothetical protein
VVLALIGLRRIERPIDRYVKKKQTQYSGEDSD